LNELELVIFDLAGTTVEDSSQVPAAFTAAFAEHGIDVTAEQIDGVRGASKRLAVLHFIPERPQQERLAAEVYDAFRAHLRERYAVAGVRPIPGAVQTFGLLRERGVRLALNTGFDRETTELLLEPLGWMAGIVDAIVCGDDVTQGRPAPDLIFQAMTAARGSQGRKRRGHDARSESR
jgi:phosphonatase-like hydrolase